MSNQLLHLTCPTCGKPTVASGGRRYLAKPKVWIRRRVCQDGHASGFDDDDNGYAFGVREPHYKAPAKIEGTGARYEATADGRGTIVRFGSGDST